MLCSRYNNSLKQLNDSSNFPNSTIESTESHTYFKHAKNNHIKFNVSFFFSEEYKPLSFK